MVKLRLREHESISDAVKRFRKLVEHAGIKKEMRRREYYEKPSDQRRRARRRAERRADAADARQPVNQPGNNCDCVNANGLRPAVAPLKQTYKRKPPAKQVGAFLFPCGADFAVAYLVAAYFDVAASTGLAGGMIVSLIAWMKKIFLGDFSFNCCTFSSADSRAS